jgi:hypothetical protein
VVGRSGGRRLSHIGEGGKHSVFIALDHLHYVCARVLRFFVALEIVNVFDTARRIVSERCLQLLLGSIDVGGRRGTAADGIDLAGIAFRLSFAGWDDDGVLGLLQLFGGAVVGLLVLPQPAQHADAFEQHGRALGGQVLCHFAGAHLERRWGGGPDPGCGRASTALAP